MMSLLENLPHVCTAKKRVRTADGMAGSIDTFTTVFSDRPCWRQGAEDREVAWWQQRSMNITHNIYFADNPSINENHVIVMGSEIMDVLSQAEPDDSVGLGILWRLAVNKISRVA